MKPEIEDYKNLSKPELIKILLKRDVDDIIRKQTKHYHCECGSKVSRDHKARHLRTKKHQAYKAE